MTELVERISPSYFKKFSRLVFNNSKINMTNWIDILTEVYGDRISVHLDRELNYPFFRGKDLSYRTINLFVNRIGNGLKNAGVRKGERVVLITSNRIELAFACFATMKIGAIAVPLNFMFKAPEIRYIAENCGAKTVIIDSDVYILNVKDQGRIPGIERWIILPKEDAPAGFHDLRRLMNEASEKLEPAPVGPEDTVAILYTSGTTGFPKGAMLTNDGFSIIIRRFARLSALFRTPRNHMGVFTLPIAHIMGYIMMSALLALAVPWVFITRFDPVKIIRAIEEYKGTIFLGVPTMYTMLFNAGLESANVESMRAWGSAADAMPIEYIKRLKRLGGPRLLGIRFPSLYFEGYGQVETVGITCLRHSWLITNHIPGCIGRPVRNVKIRIVDSDGRDVKRGEVGELLVQSQRNTKGYWTGDGKANRDDFIGEWLKTGDLVRRDWLGRLYFIDRKKEMIKCGGYSIFSKEVEEEMKHHPKIANAALVGMPHPEKGQVPVAFVSLKPGERVDAEEIIAWARENIANYKAPRYVEILDDMPLGMTMKVSKKDLKAAFMEKYTKLFQDEKERTG